MASSQSSNNAATGELWSQILRESSRQSSQLPCTHLVLLGDRNCGKTSLLIKLQQRQEQAEQLAKGVALDYSFLEVLDDDSDGTFDDLEHSLRAPLSRVLTRTPIPPAYVCVRVCVCILSGV